jgi:hypothetical protein
MTQVAAVINFNRPRHFTNRIRRFLNRQDLGMGFTIRLIQSEHQHASYLAFLFSIGLFGKYICALSKNLCKIFKKQRNCMKILLNILFVVISNLYVWMVSLHWPKFFLLENTLMEIHQRVYHSKRPEYYEGNYPTFI